MAMKISADVTRRGVSAPGILHYTVLVQFDGPVETLNITATIHDQNDKESNRAAAITRAKDLARQFHDFSSAT
jgi:hypothetical protein